MLHPSGHRLRLQVVGAGLGALAAGWALSGVYEVGPDQTGMVTRFGAFVGEVGPGLNYHLPAPIERVRLLTVGAPQRLDVGADDASDGPGPMLTRDGALANVEFGVQWRIVDPYRYTFEWANPAAALRRDAVNAVREAVRQVAFADITTLSRGGVAGRAAALLQTALNREGAGVAVVGLQIRNAEPPEGAQAGFHDMVVARQDAQAATRGVDAYRARVLAEAHADANKADQAAQGARDQEISEAHGEADRFALVDAQYQKAPDVTRERLYTETMERVLHNVRKVIVQPAKGAGGQIVLPPDLFRTRPDASTPQGNTTQAPSGPAQPDTHAAPSPASQADAAGPTA